MGLLNEIEKIREEICDKYCKYPDKYREESGSDDDRMETMFDEVCINCPLIRL